MKFKNLQELEDYCFREGISILPDAEKTFSPNTDYTIKDITNPENKQKLIRTIIPLKDVNFYEAEKRLAITNRYYDWSDTIADRLKGLQERLENGEIEYIPLWNEAAREYNELVANYSVYSDEMTFAPLIDKYTIDKAINFNIGI